MTIYQWLCLIGVPALIGSVWAYVIGMGKQIRAFKLGLQALLRVQMVNMHDEWVPKGYMPLHCKQLFECLWTNYHSLGVNGVMDSMHEEVLALPTSPVIEKEETT